MENTESSYFCPGGYKDSIQSSITILAGSLQSNRTYQFLVEMINRKNPSRQSTGSVLVQVTETYSPLISIGRVISTSGIPNVEYQLINPTTQMALYGICSENCSNLQSIQWNIYSGKINSSTNLTTWILFNQNNSMGNNWFFGKI